MPNGRTIAEKGFADMTKQTETTHSTKHMKEIRTVFNNNRALTGLSAKEIEMILEALDFWTTEKSKNVKLGSNAFA